jgi:nitrite reductase/ring-hydroxylating ferredoxin subunit
MRRDPLWREEISIFSADEKYVNRRQFAKFLVLTSIGMFVGNLWILVKSWLTKIPVYPLRSIAKISEIPVGGFKLFTYPTAADPCILVRTAENELAAYSQKCTHLSCAVYYVHQNHQFECPCHQGYFSAKDGRVLQGPPQRPLPRILLQQKGDDLIATGIDLGEA